MTILANNIRIEGNSLVIRSQPATGLLALTSFIDDETGVSGPIFFEKYFRYSINGVIFGDWMPLTLAAITSISVQPTDILVIELQYFKQEPLGTNVLNVTEVQIGANKQPVAPQYYFDKTVFKQFFDTDDVEVLNWYINVLNKLYERGLLPSFIDRMDDFNSPEDFLVFWRSIAQFFSYLVIYARKFQKFYESETLLSEYLEEHGMKTSIQNSLVELNYLMVNFYKQIFNRGTNHIVDRVEEGDIIDGELLRLIWYRKDEDEFIFNLHKPEHFGWNLGNSSPLYRGLYLNDNANKFGDKNYIPEDITKYPPGVTLTQDDGHNVLSLLGTMGSSAYKIKVSDSLDYEFSFLIKKEQLATLTVRLQGYDKDFNPVNCLSYKDGAVKNDFFTDANLSRDDKYVLVRLFLYNKAKDLFSDDTTEIHQGTDLILGDKIVWIAPFIEVSGGSALLYGVRFLPLATPYSHGLIQTNHWISCWLKNRNHHYQL